MNATLRLALAERDFQRHYERGGTGLADDVWKRIATRYGVLGLAADDE